MRFGRNRFAPLDNDIGPQFVVNAIRLAERSHVDSINSHDSRKLQIHLQKNFDQFSKQQKQQYKSILEPQDTIDFKDMRHSNRK